MSNIIAWQDNTDPTFFTQNYYTIYKTYKQNKQRIMRKKRSYTTFDEQRAIRKAQKLINRINKKQKPLRSIRIDANTIIQIRADHPDADLILDRIRNKRHTIGIVEEIEYGHYA